MDIISACREAGTYRGAAVISGTTPKTVRRVIARHDAGGGTPARSPRGHDCDVVATLVAERVKKTAGRISAKRLLPAARAGGYAGSPRNFRRLVAAQKQAWRRDHHRGRRPAVWSPGEHLVIDWGAEGGLHVFCAVLAWCRFRFVRFAADDCRVNCGLRSADRRGRRLSRSRGVQRLGARLTCRLWPAGKLLDDYAPFAQTCRDSASGIADACGPGSPGSHRVVWGLTARPPVPLRAFLRFPVCPPGSPPSPAVPGLPSSGVLRFGPFGRCPVPVLRRFPSGFPSLSNLHVSAAAGRFRRRRSRAAGTKVTSPAATTSPGSRDPPALQMGSGRARWDAAAESPVTSGRERRTSLRPNRPERFTHVTQLVGQRRSVTGGRRDCAASADGTGARSRSFPPAGLAGSRGFLRSPGPASTGGSPQRR